MQTIYVLSTAPGKSGVAVIRISGMLARESLKTLGISTLPTPRVATLCSLRQAEEVIDKALVLYFPAPDSFTGEDVVELHCHGSRAIIRQLLAVLAAIPDYRMAEPGEFTRRAFLNGKMDLTAAEGLADLIDADTEAQARQAMRIMRGDASKFYEDLRKSVLHSLAFLEAYIDFPDEDIPDEVLRQVGDEIGAAKALITGQLGDNGMSEKIREGIYIAILGAPNAGKSSLLNMLAKRDVAIVSSIAGTTRDVIEVTLDIKGYPVILADTAGIREHGDVIEQEGIRRSLERAARADVKIVVLDAQEVASCRLQVASLSLPATCNLQLATIIDSNTIVLMNKSDLATPDLSPINGITPILFSVKERIGFEALIQVLEEKIEAIITPELSFITRSRHRAHLTAALAHLERYAHAQGQGLELACEELRRAATEVGRITGTITSDEVLGHIFSSFCIGK